MTWYWARLSPLAIEAVEAIERDEDSLWIVTRNVDYSVLREGEQGAYFRDRGEAIKWLIARLEEKAELASAELEDCRRKLGKARAWAALAEKQKET